MSKIGLLCLVDDVVAQMALGLAQQMCPFFSDVTLVDEKEFFCALSSRSYFSDKFNEEVSEFSLAKILLAELGISFECQKKEIVNEIDFERGLLIIPRFFDLDRLQNNDFFLKRQQSIGERWEPLVVGPLEGGFPFEGTMGYRMLRGQVRDGVQHFFRRSEGLLLEEEPIL